MSNNLGSRNDYTQNVTRDARQGPAPAADGVGQRAHGSAGFEHAPTRAEAEQLVGLLPNRLLSALPQEDFSRLFPHLEPVTLKAGDVLYRMDAVLRYSYFPQTAVISHLHILSEGGMTEADMVGREGMTGLSAVFRAPAPAYLTEVSLGGSALRVRIESLRHEFERCGALQRLLLAYASERIALLSRRAVCNGNHRVEERLCTWLLMMHDRAGDKPLALTHERISRHLGTRRAGVTCAATALRDRGVIGYTRGHISILDRAALQNSACECYPAFRRSYDAIA